MDMAENAPKAPMAASGKETPASREHFASRLGFILISAGCAIGLGNVWRFPYITGEYGGGAVVHFGGGLGARGRFCAGFGNHRCGT